MKIKQTTYTNVFQLATYADNVALPASPTAAAEHQLCTACSKRSISPDSVRPSPRQQDRQTDTVPLHRPCSAYYVSSATHTHTRLTALFPGLTRLAGTRKAKPIWILLKQETVNGSGISWGHMQVCISLQTDNHSSTPPLKFFPGRTPFLPPNQQRQSTESHVSSANKTYM